MQGRSLDFQVSNARSRLGLTKVNIDNKKTDLNFEWHKTRLVLAEMIHFIRQLEAYSRLEVIECSWKVLTEFLHKKDGDLDALIEAHRSYLDRMTRKILLLSSKPGKEEVLQRQLVEIFTLILQFREAMVNTLYSEMVGFFLTIFDRIVFSITVSLSMLEGTKKRMLKGYGTMSLN